MTALFGIHFRRKAPRIFAECYADRPEFDSKTFRKELKSCRVFTIELGADIIGALAGKNGYFHIGILPQYRKRWATKARLLYIARWASAHGYTLTKARTSSLGERMAIAGGMVPKAQIEGGTEYVVHAS